MAGGIVYLDVDDEITSAAARVRNATGRRVGLVLPYGSRVATSRINFRLLSRDALISEKYLAVIAGDSATRALAASAGLPVFGSVAEYESSLAGPDEEAAAVAPPPPPPVAARSHGFDPAPATPAPPEPTRAQVEPRTVTLERQDPVRAPAGRTDPIGGEVIPQSMPRHRSRLPVVIALGVVGLILVAGGVGAYVVLPSATIVVTPRPEALPRLAITVTADPAAKAPDAARRVIPAEIVSVAVSTSNTFPATGKRVEESVAKGTVRFENLDFLRSNTVPAGSVISTNAGVRFRTVAAVTVPKADLVGLMVFPGRIIASVTAVEPGTAGNVEPNTIVIVPKGEDPKALKVVNKEPTEGGTREEFPVVAQEDVDGAMSQLTIALGEAFLERLADPLIGRSGAAILRETADLGEPTPTVDPATFVGQEIETFDLGLSASGTVLAVDPTLVAQMADALLRATVDSGHALVAGSIEVDVGDPTVTATSITFPATATGRQIAVLDPGLLRELVLGKSLDDARQALAPYGAVELTAWPDWVGSVPTVADRVEVRIEGSVPVETSAPSGSRS